MEKEERFMRKIGGEEEREEEEEKGRTGGIRGKR